MASDERILAALARLPGAAERIASARIEDGVATLVLDVTGLDAAAAATMEREAKEAVGAMKGIRATRIAATASRRDRTIVAIGSGKGGVGKSTLAANLAVALARKGHKVGLVDADIYGPSQPRIMGCELRPEAVGKKMIPLEAHGVRMLSIGQLVEPGSALAWRGPMVSQALAQLMDGDWSGVDLLLVDLPPGTGDIHLSLLQKYRPQGAVVVSTPQDLALIDARRAIDLFGKLHVPMLGIVENMAGFACPACGTVSEPFGAGGAERAAGELGIPFLGSIPLAMPIRIASDSGTPPAAGSGPEADAFARLADGLLEQLARLRVAKEEGAA